MATEGLWMPRPTDTDPNSNINEWNIPTRNPQSELDREAFLMLLVAQMRHQDPLNPMDDRDFLAQMAQFSALEQQMHQTRALEQKQAFGMIGRTIDANWFCEDSGQWKEVDGQMVTAVSRRPNGQVFLRAGNESVPMDAIRFVEDSYLTALQLQGILDGVNATRDLNFIGRYVQAVTVDARRNPTGFVEGRGEYVRFFNGQAVFMVNGQEIFAPEIISVSGQRLVIGRPINAEIVTNDGRESISGTVNGIHFGSNNRIEVDISGRRVPLDRVDFLVEALQLVGQHIDRAGYAGTVNAVTMRGGMPYLELGAEIGERRVSIEAFREAGQ